MLNAKELGNPGPEQRVPLRWKKPRFQAGYLCGSQGRSDCRTLRPSRRRPPWLPSPGWQYDTSAHRSQSLEDFRRCQPGRARVVSSRETARPCPKMKLAFEDSEKATTGGPPALPGAPGHSMGHSSRTVCKAPGPGGLHLILRTRGLCALILFRLSLLGRRPLILTRRRPPELADPLAQRPTNLRQSPHAENDKYHHQNYYQLHRTNIERHISRLHTLMPPE